MTWGAVAGAAIGVVGSAMSSGGDKNGGAGTQTVDRAPWAAAQPWITNNLAQGQRLQTAYQNQPFSGAQNQAYQNQANQSDYMRAAVPSLLGQMSGKQVGFDRSNPNARPEAFDFNNLLGAAQVGNAAAAQGAQSRQPQPGALSMLNSSGGLMGNLTAQTPQIVEPPKPAGNFVQQAELTPIDQYNAVLNQFGASGYPGLIPGAMAPQQMSASAGGFGSFKYGDQPQPGTQQYYDQQQYFLYGGADPFNVYGRQKFAASPFGQGGYGAATDDGGAAAAVGSSANF